jgi:hypothetical protein
MDHNLLNELAKLTSKAFYGLHIEDMWLPFFCNTTNINVSRMEIHETGYAWRFIRRFPRVVFPIDLNIAIVSQALP